MLYTNPAIENKPRLQTQGSGLGLPLRHPHERCAVLLLRLDKRDHLVRRSDVAIHLFISGGRRGLEVETCLVLEPLLTDVLKQRSYVLL